MAQQRPPLVAALLIALLLLAAIGKAVADADAHGSPRLMRWFPRWSGPDSWKFKYKDGSSTAGPRFWGSTTGLVFLTDLWHFSNFVTWAAVDAAVLLAAFPAYRWCAVGAVVGRRCAFQPIYAWLRK